MSGYYDDGDVQWVMVLRWIEDNDDDDDVEVLT